MPFTSNPFRRTRAPPLETLPSMSSETGGLVDPPPAYERHDSAAKDSEKKVPPVDNKSDPAKEEISPLQKIGGQTWETKWQVDQLKLSEDQLAALRNYDTVIVLDDSGSMWQKDRGIFSSRTRWKAATEAVSQLAQKAIEYDNNGIDLVFINEQNREHELFNIKNSSKVTEICEAVRNQHFPTPTGKRINELLEKYEDDLRRSRATKKLNILVITDGAATDNEDLVRAIVKHAKFLDRHDYPLDQTGIQFVQVGNDKSATAFLQALDNDYRAPWSLNGNNIPRDLIDTVPYTGGELNGAALMKVLLGAINRKIDRQR
ncbi:hypothetical protein BC835DRAFT_132406 [Cytidiella melzeri]|nr:hypothetical protein BC835DRAFT_132406 [Cytidiella melzeri]